MPTRPEEIRAFPTAFGRNLLAEVPNFVAAPYLVVTMEDLWPRFSAAFPPGTELISSVPWIARPWKRISRRSATMQVS